jgi:hypothetical protein
MSSQFSNPNKDKPWLLTNKGFHQTFYPSAWGKPNCYSIFSPGIDRFLLVDHYDFWIVYETAKVLSSKISTIVYVLDQETPEMTVEECLNFTTKHKKLEKNYGGPSVMSHRQSASLSKIPKDLVVRVGWPEDFIKPDRLNALMQLQEYALFSLRTIYAVTISSHFTNFFPEREYIDDFFNDQCPGDFELTQDNSSYDQGMIKLVKQILYDAKDVESALEQIHESWRKYTQHDVSGHRQLFYQILGIDQPDDLKLLGDPGMFDKEKNHQTTWVV